MFAGISPLATLRPAAALDSRGGDRRGPGIDRCFPGKWRYWHGVVPFGEVTSGLPAPQVGT